MGRKVLPNISDGPDGVTYGEYMRQRDLLWALESHPVGTRVTMAAHLNTEEWSHHPRNYRKGTVVDDNGSWVYVLFDDDSAPTYIPRRFVAREFDDAPLDAGICEQVI